VVRRWLAGSAVKCEPADGPGKARASGRARVGHGLDKAAGVLLTGQVGATPTRTRQGRGLPRTRQARWNLDSDPVALTTRQVQGCMTRACLAVRLCSAALASCPTCNTCILCNLCKPVCVFSQGSNSNLLALLIFSIFFSPVSPILANTPAPPSVLSFLH
jgi:hypothetical protein